MKLALLTLLAFAPAATLDDDDTVEWAPDRVGLDKNKEDHTAIFERLKMRTLTLANDHVRNRKGDEVKASPAEASRYLKDLLALQDEINPCMGSSGLSIKEITDGGLRALTGFANAIFKLGRGASRKAKEAVFKQFQQNGTIKATCKFNPNLNFHATSDAVLLFRMEPVAANDVQGPTPDGSGEIAGTSRSFAMDEFQMTSAVVDATERALEIAPAPIPARQVLCAVAAMRESQLMYIRSVHNKRMEKTTRVATSACGPNEVSLNICASIRAGGTVNQPLGSFVEILSAAAESVAPDERTPQVDPTVNMRNDGKEPVTRRARSSPTE